MNQIGGTLEQAVCHRCLAEARQMVPGIAWSPARGVVKRKAPMTYLSEESLPPGTKLVVESCGSSQKQREFVHLFLEFTDGRIESLGIRPAGSCCPNAAIAESRRRAKSFA